MTAPADASERDVAVPDAVAHGRWPLWLVLGAGMGAWAIHIVGGTAMARLSCNDSRYRWAEHGLTLATAAITAAALLVCVTLVRRTPGDDESSGPAGRTRFLGLVGALVNAISLALILVEGFYVLVFRGCG